MNPQSGFPLSRRDFLWQFGGGLGGVALAHLLAREGALADAPRPQFGGGLHHSAKARRVLQLFMNGGVSQVDTFDYKPALEQRHGENVDFGIQSAATSPPGAILKSPFRFRQHGACGRWVSEVFPHVAGHVDDLAFLMAMTAGSRSGS